MFVSVEQHRGGQGGGCEGRGITPATRQKRKTQQSQEITRKWKNNRREL